MTEPNDQFIIQFTECQSQLYAFLLAQLGTTDQACEVLQNTNLVIWKKSAEYEPGTNFMAWVFRIARFQILAFCNKQKRDKLIFSEAAMTRIACAFVDDEADEPISQRQRFLKGCLNKLSENLSEIVERRYGRGQPIQIIADETGKTYQAIGQSLRRARLALAKCIKLQEVQQ